MSENVLYDMITSNNNTKLPIRISFTKRRILLKHNIPFRKKFLSETRLRLTAQQTSNKRLHVWSKQCAFGNSIILGERRIGGYSKTCLILERIRPNKQSDKI